MPLRASADRLVAAVRKRATTFWKKFTTSRTYRATVLKRTVVWSLFAGGVLFVALSLMWWTVCAGDACPSAETLEKYTPRQTSKVYAADGRLIGELGLERRTVIRVADIPKPVRDAFVMIEDKRFYEHHGIDYRRVLGAVIHNIRALGFSEGFSTITMQLARNVFPERLTREKTLIRKFKEAKVALDIEKRFTKDQILELYLNQIPFGARSHGIESAAQRYFGKSARQLNVAEAALLAGLPKAPERYNPIRYPERAIQRRNTILEVMRQGGSISDAEASLAKAWPMELARASTGRGEIAPYFLEWVRQIMQQKYGAALYDKGYEIHTTLDLDLQIAAERSFAAQLQMIESGQYGKWEHTTYEQYMSRSAASRDEAAANSPYLQGCFIALDPRSGAVRVLIGGRDFEDSKFNRATQALRQPGSTFKPIVYATAIRAGKPPSYILDDSPLSMPQLDGSTWSPQNYDLTFKGPTPMRRALYESRNLPAIRLGMEIGEPSVIDMARRFGITADILPVPSINIGAADVIPMEMVNAYSVFANLGWRSQPTPIVDVRDASGRVLWTPTPQHETVLSPEEAWLMTDMLRDVVRRGTAVTAVWNAGFHIPSGGKTGTTNDYSDVWFIGFTADLVAGVWMGFDKRTKIISNAQGGRLAAPAWTQFMLDAYRRKPTPTDWPRPSGLIAVEVDEATGQRRGLCTDHIVTEWFIRGTEPTDMCMPGFNNTRGRRGH